MKHHMLGQTMFLKPILVAIATFAMLLCGSARCFSQSNETIKFFLGDAPIKWLEYAELTKDICVQMDQKTWERPFGKSFSSEPTKRLQVKRNKAHTLLLQAFDTPFVASRCYGLNDHYAFELSRKEMADVWTLAGFSTEIDTKKGPSYLDSVLQRDKVGSRSFAGPFYFQNGSVKSLVKEPGFKVKDAAGAKIDGREVVRIDFICKRDKTENANSTSFHYESGWFALDPNNYWRLCEYEILVNYPPHYQTPDRKKISLLERGKLECRALKNGLPIDKTLWISLSEPNEHKNNEPKLEIKTEFSFEEREPERDEFTLSAFGLPEPMGMPPVKAGCIRWYIWIAMGALVSLGLFVLIRQLTQRNFRRQPGR